jgi:hypothetical protein
MSYDVGNPVLGLGQIQKYGVQPSPLDNRISNGNAYAKNVKTDEKKNQQNFFSLKKTTYCHKK